MHEAEERVCRSGVGPGSQQVSGPDYMCDARCGTQAQLHRRAGTHSSANTVTLGARLPLGGMPP